MYFLVAKLLKCVFGNEKYCQSMKKLWLHGQCCQLNADVKNSAIKCEKCVGKSLVKTATTCQKTTNDLRHEESADSANKVGRNDGKDLPIVFTCCSCGSDGSDIDSHRLFSFVLRSFS